MHKMFIASKSSQCHLCGTFEIIRKMKKEYDIFISHASEDKEEFVRPLANSLKSFGVKVWYDEFTLRIGRSLSRSIDKGIVNSNYAAIVLSPYFFKKNWTEYELKSFNSFEIENSDIILPIWKNVSVQDVRNFSPYMADKISLIVENLTIEEIAIKIIEVARPDIFENYHKKLAYERRFKDAKTMMIDPKKISLYGPLKHEPSSNIVSRVRLIRSSLWHCYPHSMHFWLDGFLRDTKIDGQLRYWEKVASSFNEIFFLNDTHTNYLGEDLAKDLFTLIISVIDDPRPFQEIEIGKKFGEKTLSLIEKSMRDLFPIYDINEESPFEKNPEEEE